MRENLGIYDRIGGGDGFAPASFRLPRRQRPHAAVESGAAHGALAMTTPHDASMVNVKEAEAIVKDKGTREIR